MSKPGKESPAVAPETTAESPNGATNIKQKYEHLLSIDVSEFTEKKNGLTYLSWSHAWSEALKIDPTASFHVESWTDDAGNTRCWMDVNGTALVWVRVTMLGQSRTCMLPVMNSKNEPISIEGRKFTDKYGKERTEKLDAFNVNTAIMRCMTKCLALFGLGLNVYAGEDLPMVSEDPEVKKVEPKKVEVPKAEPEKLADMKLFADGVIQYVEVCTTLSGLKSYWMKNENSINELKEKEPALFEQVRDVFTAKRKEMEKADGK